MELRTFSLERYKGYAKLTEIELAPLTILVGANNSGKTALAQAIQLLAGGLAPSDKETSEPLPLASGGIRHGQVFEDLVTGRVVHGWVCLSVRLADDGRELSLSATVRNVLSSTSPSERQIWQWSFRRDDQTVVVERQGFDKHSSYKVNIPGIEQKSCQVVWRGLIPQQPKFLGDWVEPNVNALKAWALGVRHLRCPRRLLASPLPMVDQSTVDLGPYGEKTPLALAADGELRESLREWYRRAFSVSIDVVTQGPYFELMVRSSTRDTNVRLVQSGRGLAHVLPVATTALTAGKAGPGVDIIEHPEAELHPAAHADIAELLLSNLVGPTRPMVIETHSEMMLLRARRWIAEGRLSPENVLVYWIDSEPVHGSIIRKIRISETGEMEQWPDGVFIEDYEEILAIQRSNRLKA